ncbi:MAG: hypothetical protein JEZ14_05715 [Marinilabiliaceae bacterium]|nr:hypothetical protein [Marinilabiliaceae bacterium]
MKTILCCLFLIIMPFLWMTAQKNDVKEIDKLKVICSGGDSDVGIKVCFMYGVAEQLCEMGIDVKGMRKPVTDTKSIIK